MPRDVDVVIAVMKEDMDKARTISMPPSTFQEDVDRIKSHSHASATSQVPASMLLEPGTPRTSAHKDDANGHMKQDLRALAPEGADIDEVVVQSLKVDDTDRDGGNNATECVHTPRKESRQVRPQLDNLSPPKRHKSGKTAGLQ